MTEPTAPAPPPVEVGRYERLSQARERALVVAAMELPHWIVRQNRGFALQVEPAAEAEVRRELERFEAEQSARPLVTPATPLPPVETRSLYVAGWFFAAAWLMQNFQGPEWGQLGAASSQAIVHGGQWWRALTALTLHGDASHFAANLASGLLFARFVLPHLGAGLTWLAVVLSGFIGNLFNAVFYHATPHGSIGASTAVFGALGLLVALELAARLASPDTRSRWQLILPLGAGLALLAFLGAGDAERPEFDRTDFMAHFWGFFAGMILGACAAWTGVRRRLSSAGQLVAGLLGPLLIAGAWLLAWAQGR